MYVCIIVCNIHCEYFFIPDSESFIFIQSIIHIAIMLVRLFVRTVHLSIYYLRRQDILPSFPSIN